MTLDEAQRAKVVEWVAQGLKLSDIQNRLMSELHVTMTYMEVRFLVDDLKLTLKDPEPVKPSQSPLAAPAAAPTPGGRLAADPAGMQSPAPTPGPGGAGRISLTVDQITRPGAIVSGKVTFSDGISAVWQIDQTGQLGMIPSKPGYRPPATDVQPFQMALEAELSKLGL
jgi:hypothetical protein